MTAIRQVKANINFKGTTDTTETENQNPKGGSNTGAALGTGIVASAATAGVMLGTDLGKRTPTAAEVLDNLDLANKLPEQLKKRAEAIAEEYKNIPKEAEKQVKKHFKSGLFGLGKGKTEIKVKKYLGLGKTPENLTKKIENLVKRQKGEVKNPFVKFFGMLRDNIRPKLQPSAFYIKFKHDASRKFFFLDIDDMFRGKEILAERIEKLSNKLKIAQGAKDGKITKDAFHANILSTLKAALTDKLDKVLQEGGKDALTKIKDIRKITITSIIAAVLTFIGAKMFIKPNQPIVAQEPIEEPDVEVADAAESTETVEEEKAA